MSNCKHDWVYINKPEVPYLSGIDTSTQRLRNDINFIYSSSRVCVICSEVMVSLADPLDWMTLEELLEKRKIKQKNDLIVKERLKVAEGILAAKYKELTGINMAV